MDLTKDESARKLQKIMADLGIQLTLEETKEYGVWLLDLYVLLAEE